MHAKLEMTTEYDDNDDKVHESTAKSSRDTSANKSQNKNNPNSRSNRTNLHSKNGCCGRMLWRILCCRFGSFLPSIKCTSFHFFVVLYGQIMSLTQAAAFAAMATLRLDCNLSAPTLSITPLYLALSTFVIPLYWIRGQERRKEQQQQLQSSSHELALQDAMDGKEHGKGSHAMSSSAALFDNATTPVFDDNELLVNDNDDDQQTLTSRTSRISRTKERKSSGHSHHSTNSSRTRKTQQSQDAEPFPGFRYPRYSFLGVIPLSRPFYVFVIAALADLYAQIFVIWAFKYTTITSVAVMDALSIPSAMILSRFWLGRRYALLHFVGVAASMSGILLNIFADFAEDMKMIKEIKNLDLDQEYPQKAKGDAMAFVGGVLFGFSNTITENLVRDVKTAGSRKTALLEYVAMSGVIGSFICFVHIYLFEREMVQIFAVSIDAKETCSQDKVTGLWIFFSVCCFVGFVGMARFLQISEAVFYNLSLLTGDFFCVGFQIIHEHLEPLPLFYPSLVLIIGGTLIYEMTTSPVARQEALRERNQALNSAILESVESDPQRKDNKTRGRAIFHRI